MQNFAKFIMKYSRTKFNIFNPDFYDDIFISKIQQRHTSFVTDTPFTKVFDINTIKDFLISRKMVYDIGSTCVITTCPKHSLRQLHLKQIEKLFINSTTGQFVCHSCGKTGSFEVLKKNIDVLFKLHENKTKKRPIFKCFENLEVTSHDSHKLATQYWNDQLKYQSLSHNDAICNDVTLMIKEDIFEKYNVRLTKDKNSFVFPLFSADGRISNCKVVKINNIERTFEYIPQTKVNNVCGLFGWNTINKNDREVVLASSELDAMIINQSTNLPCVSLPFRTSLPQQILPLLEQFQKIILWLGGDDNTWQVSRQLSKKLGDSRCFLVRPSNERPNPFTALKNKLNLSKIINNARSPQNKSIVSFQELRQDVFVELSEVDIVSGVKWKRYPQLVKLLKGHRRGELTIFTGPTGSGKTTFMSEYSLDLCLQGVNTLWGSFEISNVRLLKTMITQFARESLAKCALSKYNKWADEFQKYPMFFMTFHGQQHINHVIETMSHAVYMNDIGHIIVDNLQFMMGLDSSTSSDRFLKQDQIIAAFRKFATHMNCHVTIVIHPRKENEMDNLSVSSIFGSAKAGQEADNILILQDRRVSMVRGKKFIQVAKNRFDGDLGIVLLNFDKDSLCFSGKKKQIPILNNSSSYS